MIRRYNQIQTIKAVFLMLAGMVCCVLAYVFFRYLPALLAWQLHFRLSPSTAIGIGIFGVAVTWISGYRIWKAKGGLFSYHESGLYHDLGELSGGAMAVDHYAHRVTSPAYALGQLFMAGPLCIFKAWTLVSNRIPYSAELEMKLENTLAMVRAANKWQGFDEHPGARAEILRLAQMDLIDFSAHKGTPRFKIK